MVREVHPQGGKAIVGRLCALLLPPDKAEEARQRARREQGQSVTEETLAAAQYVVVFTTVPSSRLTAALVMELYGLRWQIKLHIKRDKSIAGLDRCRTFAATLSIPGFAPSYCSPRLPASLPRPTWQYPPVGISTGSASDDQKCIRAAHSRSKDRIVAEPWRLMAILWQSVLAALIPVSASQLPGLLQAFLEHLQRQVPRRRLRSAVKFQQHLAEELG